MIEEKQDLKSDSSKNNNHDDVIDDEKDSDDEDHIGEGFKCKHCEK